ncbi:MAG TPA: gluconokinase [Bacilli bacterium]|nr:gluconokinase [Bacilli bacterium]
MTTLTIDIGTTSTKLILFDHNLNQLALVKKDYQTTLSDGGFAEQDPEQIFTAIHTGLEEVLTDQSLTISEIVFSSAMHSLLGIDPAGNPLTPLIIWSDNRADKQIDHFKQQPEAMKFFAKTGTPIHPMSPFAKLLWFKEESNLTGHVAKWIGIKEFIWYRLTGRYQVDFSIASATGLFNSERLDWDDAILTRVGLTRSQLSEPVDVTYSCPVENDFLLKINGIDRETTLVIGGSDGCLANLASVVTGDQIANLTIGTSGAIRLTTDVRVIDPEGRLFCYYLRPGEWVLGGAVNNGGNVLTWLDQLLFEKSGRLFEVLETIDFDGGNDLLFLPHIHGERAPFWNSHLTGEWIGLTAADQKEDLIEVATEGILFNLYDVFNLLSESTGRIEALTVSGGFFQNEKIIQLVANLFGLPIHLNQTIEQSSLGAAMLVHYPEVVDRTTLKRTYYPVDQQHEYYQKKYQKYQQVLQKKDND